MTISAKKILAAIDQLHSGFTADDLNKKVIKISDEKDAKNKKVKKKKKASRGSDKDLLKIDEILKALIYSGFIEGLVITGESVPGLARKYLEIAAGLNYEPAVKELNDEGYNDGKYDGYV